MIIPPRLLRAALMLTLFFGACQRKSPPLPGIKFKEPMVSTKAPAVAEAQPTPLLPVLEAAPTPVRLTLAEALRTGALEQATRLLDATEGQMEVKQDAPALLPLAVATGNRDLLAQFLHLKPRGLFWQQPVSQRLIQALWEKDPELVGLLRAAHTAIPRPPGLQQNLLAYTVVWNAPEQLQTLLATGSDPDEVLIQTAEDNFLNLLITPEQRKMVSTSTGVTPLILAAALGYDDVMKVLLNAGANPYATTNDGLSATGFVGTQWERLKLLLDAKPKIPAPNEIKIDLSEQWAYYYENNRMVMKCIVSSGKPQFETPPGRYLVTDKVRSKMWSIYEIEMPYFLRLNGSALGLHAGPTNGHPISHGCVRMPAGAAKLLFEKAPIGTLVTITK